MDTISAVFGHTVNLSDRISWILINTFSIHVLNTMFVIQVEIEDQPAIEGSVNEQVQDAVNVAYQEGLLPKEDIEEERWVLRRSTMAAFNTIFQGYQFINKGFMDLSKLIDGTPLNAMGQILNDIQESAARSAGYAGGGEGIGEEAEEVVQEGERGRKKGRSRERAKCKRANTDDKGDQTKNISKHKSKPQKRQTAHVLWDSSLATHPHPSHDLTPYNKIKKPHSTDSKRKVKKAGPEGILEPVRQESTGGARYYSCPYEPCELTTVSIEGMRSHIKQVHALFSYSCKYCHFTTKNFDSLKTHEKGCKGEYE